MAACVEFPLPRGSLAKSALLLDGFGGGLILSDGGISRNGRDDVHGIEGRGIMGIGRVNGNCQSSWEFAEMLDMGRGGGNGSRWWE